METDINQHFLDTIHFRPLIKDSFKEAGPDGLIDTILDYTAVDDELSLTDKVNLENHYRTLKSKEKSEGSELKDEIEKKLKEMLNERKTFKRNYSETEKESFDNKKFLDNLLKFMDSTSKSLIVLKLDDVSYKYLFSYTFSKNFSDVYRLYKLMFPNLKIDLSKSKFVFGKFKDDKSYEESNWNKFIDLTTNYSYYFEGDMKQEDFDKDMEVNNELIIKLNKYCLIDSKIIDNISLIVEKNKKISELSDELNKLINEHNELSMYKLSTVQLDTLQKSQDTQNVPQLSLETDSNDQLFVEINNDSKNSFVPLIAEDSILQKRSKALQNYYDLRPLPGISMIPESSRNEIKSIDDLTQESTERGDNCVLYNKYFGRLVLLEYFNRYLFDELKEFELVKTLSNFEYKQLIKYYNEQIDSYDESDKIEDMKEFINRCLSEISSREKEDKILIFIKDYFRFTNNLEDKMKFTEISRIVNNNFVEKVSNVQLADYLKKLGLAKKRYNDGIYWYGLVDRKEEVEKNVQKKFKELNKPREETSYEKTLKNMVSTPSINDNKDLQQSNITVIRKTNVLQQLNRSYITPN